MPLQPLRGRAAERLASLFPDADFRLQMRFQRGSIAEFFNPWPGSLEVLEQRRHWLQREPDVHSALLPAGEPLLEEWLGRSQDWGLQLAFPPGQPDALHRLRTLGRTIEPDFLLLQPDEAGEMSLVGGCVCFPSSWSLAEKMGRPLDFIHSVVPGLNNQIGKPITQFLRRLAPDIAWLRDNWGLSRSPELNQHPGRALPRLDSQVTPDDVWLRVEHQALVALPTTGGVLFGIRVVVHRLAEVLRHPAAAQGLHRALRTMPEEMAVYKGIAPARTALLRMTEPSSA